jgi:branched-chain amino acid transport system substrate-binding protein
MIFNLPWANPKSPVTQALEASFKVANPNNRFAVDSFNAGFTLEALMIAADAFKRAGTTNGPTLMEAVRATKIDQHVMIGGPIAFDAKGQNTAIGTAVVQNQKQTPVVVYPADVAAGAPALPLASWQGRK